jgi:hypothetical protein
MSEELGPKISTSISLEKIVERLDAQNPFYPDLKSFLEENYQESKFFFRHENLKISPAYTIGSDVESIISRYLENGQPPIIDFKLGIVFSVPKSHLDATYLLGKYYLHNDFPNNIMFDDEYIRSGHGVHFSTDNYISFSENKIPRKIFSMFKRLAKKYNLSLEKI